MIHIIQVVGQTARPYHVLNGMKDHFLSLELGLLIPSFFILGFILGRVVLDPESILITLGYTGNTPWMEHQSIKSPSQVPACFCEVGGNHRTGRKPTRTLGKHEQTQGEPPTQRVTQAQVDLQTLELRVSNATNMLPLFDLFLVVVFKLFNPSINISSQTKCLLMIYFLNGFP